TLIAGRAQGADDFPLGRIPDPEPPVRPVPAAVDVSVPREDQPPVPRHPVGRYAIVMKGHEPNELAALDFPEPEHPVAVRRGELLAVGRKGDAPRSPRGPLGWAFARALLELADFLPGHRVPEHEAVFLAGPPVPLLGDGQAAIRREG